MLSFLTMPLMINYLGVEMFGVWATMLALVNWVMLFDLGVGNGLRNKITESLACNDEKTCLQYISTSYVVVGFISIIVFLLFFIFACYANWNAIFNTDVLERSALFLAVVLCVFFVLLNFIVSLVLQIFNGYQESSFVSVGQFISNAFALFSILILYAFSFPSLLKIVFAYGFSLVASNLILSFYFFSRRPSVKPRISSFEMLKVKGLFSLGMRFFIIQLSVLIIFMSDKMVIAQLLGPSEVTNYEVVFKIYGVLTILHGLFLAPLWSAFSDAYAAKDYQWIKEAMKKQLAIFILVALGAVLLAVLGPHLVGFWIGSAVMPDRLIFCFFSAYVVVSVWSNIFAYFVNAINKVGIQMCSAIFAAVLNIPLSIYFIKFLDFGVEGVVLATTVSLSVYAFIGPIQVYYILKKDG